MKTWLITYTPDRVKSEIAVIVAPTYTKALVEFMISYPNYEYTGIIEVIENESALA